MIKTRQPAYPTLFWTLRQNTFPSPSDSQYRPDVRVLEIPNESLCKPGVEFHLERLSLVDLAIICYSFLYTFAYRLFSVMFYLFGLLYNSIPCRMITHDVFDQSKCFNEQDSGYCYLPDPQTVLVPLQPRYQIFCSRPVRSNRFWRLNKIQKWRVHHMEHSRRPWLDIASTTIHLKLLEACLPYLNLEKMVARSKRSCLWLRCPRVMIHPFLSSWLPANNIERNIWLPCLAVLHADSHIQDLPVNFSRKLGGLFENHVLWPISVSVEHHFKTTVGFNSQRILRPTKIYENP